MNSYEAYLVGTAYDKVERAIRRSTPGWGRLSPAERHGLVLAAVENGRQSPDSELNLLANARPSLNAASEARAILATITATPVDGSDRTRTVVAMALGLLDEKGQPVAKVSRKLAQSPKLRLGRAIRAQRDSAELMEHLVATERALRRLAVVAGTVAPSGRQEIGPASSIARAMSPRILQCSA